MKIKIEALDQYNSDLGNSCLLQNIFPKKRGLPALFGWEREVKKLHETVRNIHSGLSPKMWILRHVSSPHPSSSWGPFSHTPTWGYHSSLHPPSMQSTRSPLHCMTYPMQGQLETDSCDLLHSVLDMYSELYTTHCGIDRTHCPLTV